jgi:DNA ligase (NAD+)
MSMNLIEELKYHDDLYALGMPEISDADYDELKALAKIDHPNDPYLNQVGASVVGDKVKLPYVLGSLNKTKADGSYTDWAKQYGNDMMVYWAKLDGVSLYVEYKKGKFDRAMLRGDGEYGLDVSDKARLFCASELDEPVDACARAEVLLTGNYHRELGYKTRRNGCAGMLNKDSLTNIENLSVLFYELIAVEGGVPATELGRIERMKELGFGLAPYVQGVQLSENELVEVLRGWKEEMAYDIDGLVITANDSIREDALYPDNKIAFKVNEEATLCKVVGITWQVGRTGRVVPVINIEPTEIGGVTVSNATGFNYEYVADNGIGAGATIGIYRSGDVIPYIDYVEESVEMSGQLVCPSCFEPTTRKGVDMVCENGECPEQRLLTVEYFLRTLGCENVTAVTLRKLGVKTVKNAYDLDEFEIASLEGFGVRRAEQVVNEVRKTLKTTPDKLLAAFGISGVGLSTAREILKKYDFNDLWDLSAGDFMKVDGVGETTARKLVVQLPSRMGLYSYLKEEGLKWATSSNTLRGKTFTLTGNGTVKRDLLVKMIEENGGYVKGISKKVDVLVAANPNSNSGKAKKAREYNIPVIGYDELMEMLEF